MPKSLERGCIHYLNFHPTPKTRRRRYYKESRRGHLGTVVRPVHSNGTTEPSQVRDSVVDGVDGMHGFSGFRVILVKKGVGSSFSSRMQLRDTFLIDSHETPATASCIAQEFGYEQQATDFRRLAVPILSYPPTFSCCLVCGGRVAQCTYIC